jgi:hypothetical protein
VVRVIAREERCPMNESQNRIKYTREFKQDAVNLLI